MSLATCADRVTRLEAKHPTHVVWRRLGIATFGISPLTEVYDVSGRPYRVAEGRSINEVLA